MQDFEKLGVFYLGREYDIQQGEPQEPLVLYDAKDLTTHALCVGMTGSGKTGLCLSLLEEAAIDGVPAICIDPKGDLGNLLLAFPDLAPGDFRPWLEQADATRKGLSLDELAAKTAKTWKEGLESWGQSAARIQKYRDAVDIAIYTPGSEAGLPLTVLKSFAVPTPAVMNNAEAFRDRVTGAASGLLALMGIDGDPLASREHILLANILESAWRSGRSLDLGSLIREIQSPGVKKIGVVDLESFFPAKERFALAMRLNNLLASPGFGAWLTGEPLDIQRLYYTPEGKPRLTIISIAHLSDSERMFFVTLLLNEVIAWMRSQSGTSSLRALLYMDEVFGYFPPSANPPSKVPMLTLLKQARAFGLGVVLATQNPVDLDYKGLSNCGTWFLGRLQTERDKMRVLDGLEGASTSAGANFDRAKMERILSGLGNRVFLMNNVHEDQPVVMQTRWALSFLRGPLTREQIGTLMEGRKTGSAHTPVTVSATPNAASVRPVLPPGIAEVFLVPRRQPRRSETLVYRPALMGSARVFISQATLGVDHTESLTLLAPVDGDLPDHVWDEAAVDPEGGPDADKSPEDDAGFAALPGELQQAKRFTSLATELKDMLYRTRHVTLWKSPVSKEASQPGESEGDFRARIAHKIHEERDLQIEKLRQKYTPKLMTLQEKIRKAEAKISKEKEEASSRMLEGAITFGTSILGAVMGRKLGSATNVGRIGTSIRTATRVQAARGDVTAAEDNLESLQAMMEQMNKDFEVEATRIQDSVTPASLALESTVVKPKKTDVTVTRVALAWIPWAQDDQGHAEPLT